MSNKIERLFNELVEGYNLRAIKIDNETWYAINDLPLDRKAINKKMHDIKKVDEVFVNDNTKIVTNSTVTLSNLRNFDKVHNTGEMFGNFTMVNYIILSSRLGMEYKIKIIDILNEIRKNDFYIDENISNENYKKLKVRYEKVREKLETRNEILKQCYGSKLIHIKNVSKRTGIPVEFMEEHMVKNGWITAKGEVTKKGAYGKVIKEDKGFVLSERGVELIQVAYARVQQAKIRGVIVDQEGEEVFK